MKCSLYEKTVVIKEKVDLDREDLSYIAIENNGTRYNLYRTYNDNEIIKDIPENVYCLPRDMALKEFKFKLKR